MSFKEGIAYSVIPYKYTTLKSFVIQTKIKLLQEVVTPHIYLSKSGRLTVGVGYSWDGPSGPTVDTETTMVASLYHDALYQLMRTGRIENLHKAEADRLLRETMLASGASKLRAWYFWAAVKVFGGAAIK